MRNGYELTQAEKDRIFYMKALKSDECLCERYKHPGYAFCWRCYKSLPVEMQRALYKKIGNGFEAAYEEAVKFLET